MHVMIILCVFIDFCQNIESIVQCAMQVRSLHGIPHGKNEHLFLKVSSVGLDYYTYSAPTDYQSQHTTLN